MQRRAKKLVFAAFLVVSGIVVTGAALLSDGKPALGLFVLGVLLLASGATMAEPGPEDRKP